MDSGGLWLVSCWNFRDFGSDPGRSGGGGSPEFQQIVRQADELPFGFHLLKSSHRKLTEATGLFDLSEDWSDLSLSFLVGCTPIFRSQRTGHTLLRRE